MTHDDVQRWLDGYVAAWRANDADMIADLFTEDATYSYRPWVGDDESLHGRAAIVAGWLEHPDDPAAWDAAYEPFAVEGDHAVGVGWSRYNATDTEPERVYHNAYLLKFEDGRCAEFREFYMLEGR